MMIYKNLEDAIIAAEELADAMETYVNINVNDKGGYELFGVGELVQVINKD